jgi:hypothetical protein
LGAIAVVLVSGGKRLKSLAGEMGKRRADRESEEKDRASLDDYWMK